MRAVMFCSLLALAMLSQVMPATGQTVPAKPAAKVPPPAPTKAAAVAKPKAAVAKPVTVAKPAAAVAKPVPTPATKTTTAAVAKPATATTTTVANGTTAATTVPASKTTAIKTPTSASTTIPSTIQSKTAAVSSALGQAATTTSGQGISNVLPSAGGSGTPLPNDPRAPVVGQGVGTFVAAGWTVTAYGCYRTGSRLFCDFDVAYQRNAPVASNIWYTVALVDDGGKITPRHDAYFVGNDGSHFPTAYVSPTPIRFVMEYDDVDPRYSSISLVNGGSRIQNVPIVMEDPAQPEGIIPARGAMSSPTTGTQSAAAGQSGAGNPIDNATQAMNKANDQKKKAQDLWNSVKSAARPH